MVDSKAFDEMAERTDRLEVQTQYDLNPEDYQEIFYNSHECFMAHTSKDGYPMVSAMWYVVLDGLIHLSTIRDLRKKTAALLRDPRMSLLLTNFSVSTEQVKEALNRHVDPMHIINRYLLSCSRIENIQAILLKARAEVSEERELRRAVHQEMVERYYSHETPEKKKELLAGIDTPNRVVIKVRPVKVWHWDLGKMLGVR